MVPRTDASELNTKGGANEKSVTELIVGDGLSKGRFVVVEA